MLLLVTPQIVIFVGVLVKKFCPYFEGILYKRKHLHSFNDDTISLGVVNVTE